MASVELARARAAEKELGEAMRAAAGDLAQQRAVHEEFNRTRNGPLPDDLRIETVDAGGVPAEWIGLEGAGDEPALLFLHSGALVMGAARENRGWLGRLVRPLAGRALGVDYRLAPEHPYPAQLDDALTAYRWLLSEGCDPSHIGVAGESSGGGLALATLCAIRDAGLPLPAAAALASPFVDMTLSSASWEDNDDPFVVKEAMTMMVPMVLQGQDARANSPLFMRASGLPPMLIQVGTSEAIFDDGRRYAEVAAAAGVDVTFEPWDEMIHFWHGFSYLPEAQQAIERIAEFLGHHLHRT